MLKAVEAQAISMVLHELATNAAKYGALKQGFEKLDATWKPTEIDCYSFDWLESGLSGIKQTDTLGFGSMILTRILPNQLNGSVSREFSDTSYRYSLSVPQRTFGFEPTAVGPNGTGSSVLVKNQHSGRHTHVVSGRSSAV